jgi:hypothetical protein
MKYMVTKSGITLSLTSQIIQITSSDKRYEHVLEFIRNDDMLALEAFFKEPEIKIHPDVKIIDGVVHIKGTEIPSKLSKRMQELIDLKLPLDPLVNFWNKLKKNPSYHSRQSLYEFLDKHGHPITEEGDFVGYRKVRSDFKDIHTGTMDNSVGKTVSMNRSEVNDNPNITCASGLHVGAYKYVSEFGSPDQPILEVIVDPADVVTVPPDYNGEKMRVCKFFVSQVVMKAHTTPLLIKEKKHLEDYLGDEDNSEYDDEEDE